MTCRQFRAQALLAGALLMLVAAMAVTLLVVVGLQVAVPLLIRPQLVRQSTAISALDTAHITSFSTRLTTGVVTVVAGTETGPSGAWIIGNLTIEPDGKEYTGPARLSRCAQGYGGNTDKCWRWPARRNLRQMPAEKFWALQWRELGLLLLLAVAGTGFSRWRIRR